MNQIVNIQFFRLTPGLQGGVLMCGGVGGVMCKSVLPAKLREPWGEAGENVSQVLTKVAYLFLGQHPDYSLAGLLVSKPHPWREGRACALA